jgi:hypothetical protein
LDEAEKRLGISYAARQDMVAARAEYERARILSGQMTTVPVDQRTAIPIDLYLINISINENIERGHKHHMEEMEVGRSVVEERATAAHHTGFGSSGSRSFGGGRMGGGSHGGGKW